MTSNAYSLYLAGVLNEERFLDMCEDGVTGLGIISERFESFIGSRADRWLRMVEDDSTLDKDSKEEVKGAIGWFKNAIAMVTSKLSDYAKKGNQYILEKANRVLDAVEDWANDHQEQAREIEKIAKDDSIYLKQSFFDKIMMTGNQPQIGESVMSAVGNFAIISMFKMIKFALINFLSVLLRTALNSMRQIFTAEAQGAKGMVNFIIAVMFPLGVFVGTGSSSFLIPAGLFYMVQVMKSIYEQVTGQPYLQP